MSADFDAEIAQRIKAKGKPETPDDPAKKQSRIEEIASRLAELKEQYNALQTAEYDLPRILSKRRERTAYCHKSHIKLALAQISREMFTLEEALSVTKPTTLREALIVLACCNWRIDSIKGWIGDDVDPLGGAAKDRQIAEDSLDAVIPFLEKAAGVTCAELGLDSYFTPSKSPEELVADVAALKAANLGKLSAFTGAEPVIDAAEYELLKDKLRRIIIAWTTTRELRACDDEKGPLFLSLQEVASTAENEIAAMPADSLAVAAAKLVLAQMAELYNDLTLRGENGSWSCPQQAAQAALKAIEWFGLKELYDAYDGPAS